MSTEWCAAVLRSLSQGALGLVVSPAAELLSLAELRRPRVGRGPLAAPRRAVECSPLWHAVAELLLALDLCV